ncbi:MAG TPA: sodium:proton antiporter [Chloroflexota bacterium]|nr:sodium:proton antiporter [Chloroflexota bacterium]
MVLLLLASFVGAWIGHLRVPYTVGLVLVGVLVATFGVLPTSTLNPDVVLTVLIPPLLFEAAYAIRWSSFRVVAAAAIALATLGVVVSGLVTAAIMAGLAGLAGTTAIVFGFIISATDPVAVVSFFRRTRVNPDLRTLVEAESMLNDGTMVVAIGLLPAIFAAQAMSPLSVVGDALWVILGGLAVGAVAGIAGAIGTSTTNDYLVETTLSLVVAYGSYLAAGEIGASGILAAVSAGVVLGNVGRHYGVSRTTRHEIERLWEFLAFLANSIVFLLLGVAAAPEPLLTLAPTILIGVGATLFGRASAVYLVGWPLRWLTGVPSPPWQQVLFWGGLRGALPVVVAFLLPEELRGQSLPHLVLGVVLVTLLLQGLSLEPVLGRILGSEAFAVSQKEDLVAPGESSGSRDAP